MRLILSFTFAFLLSSQFVYGQDSLKYDEPWHRDVIRGSESLVLASIKKVDNKKREVTLKVEKTLAGQTIEGKITLNGFYLLKPCGGAENLSPDFDFGAFEKAYFFLKKSGDKTYQIATPTSGFAGSSNDQVFATYRHSFHQVIVSRYIYEKSTALIFKKYHGLAFDDAFAKEFIQNQLSQTPVPLDKEFLEKFFRQQVALELIYHLKIKDQIDLIRPFFTFDEFHVQVSGARALEATASPEAEALLVQALTDSSFGNFPKVICLRALTTLKPYHLLGSMQALTATASTEKTGFRQDPADPRSCTYFPTVKQAFQYFIQALEN